MEGHYMCMHHLKRALFCGNSFEIAGMDASVYDNVAADMIQTCELLKLLPEDIMVFPHVGKNIMENFKHAEYIEGANNPNIKHFKEYYQNCIDNLYYPVPAILKNEFGYNLYLRS